MPILFMGLIALAMFIGIGVLCAVAVHAEGKERPKDEPSGFRP